MKNPIVEVKLDDKRIWEVDLWTLAMLYSGNMVLERANSLKLLLDGEEVLRGTGEPTNTVKGELLARE